MSDAYESSVAAGPGDHAVGAGQDRPAVHDVDGVGHFVPLEAPAAFADALTIAVANLR